MIRRTILALVLKGWMLFAQVLAHSGAAIEGNAAPGEWSQWSPWSPCSAECRTGITFRSRTCLSSPLTSQEYDDKVLCPGKEKEIKLCNKQECANGRKGWREEECSKFDSSLHSGRRYTWEPFTHPSEPCALTCRAKGHHFYTTLTDRVVDGVPCGGATTNPSAICLQGICEEVGCDDMVGSPWRRDACGVCKGDNSTCRTISGVFTEQSLDTGMNEIIVIPAGSTLINITGLQYSINWLALQNDQGDYILNGGELKSPAGDYEAAGTIFSYKTSQKCSGQCITALGPIDQPVRLMLKTQGINHGVQYSFNVPNDVTDDYFRRILDSGEPDVTPHKTSPPTADENHSDESESAEDGDLTADAENDLPAGDRATDAIVQSIVSDNMADEEQRRERGEEEEEEEEEEEKGEKEDEELPQQMQQRQREAEEDEESEL